jgi:hypothetical protein
MFRISVLAVAFALCMPALASADSRDVMRDFGLLGTWATDCSQPSGKYNFYTVYAGMTNGNVRRTYYNTPDRKTPYNEYIITRAIRLPADQMSYSQEGTVNKDKIDVILLKDGNKYKIWSSVRSSGEVLVKEGKFPDSGDESPWQTKCYE